ncbi:MAG: hypothetical protein FJ253_06040 [Phycisphaerae bacterium]|nr:hypothetical protein [Phycisphaerae bacterium]
MKQPVLVLALVAAAWLLIEPLLHWLVRWQFDPWREFAAWLVLGALVASALHASNQKRAGWSAAFAALAVALNPVWPIGAPGRVIASASIGAGAALAMYAIRRWK